MRIGKVFVVALVAQDCAPERGDGAADQGVARAAGTEFVALESGYGNPDAFAERPAGAYPGFAAFAKAWLQQN